MRRTPLAIARIWSLALAALSLPVALAAGSFDSYAITQISTPPDGGPRTLTKWFVTPAKSRTELTFADSDPTDVLVVITRRDRGLAWTLLPSKKAYIERLLAEETLHERGMRLKDGVAVEHLGRERIRGYGCDKQRIRSGAWMGSRRLKAAQTLWVCDGFALPLRIEGEDGSRTRTSMLEVGPQPEHLFEVPSGYRKATGLQDLLRPGKKRP